MKETTNIHGTDEGNLTAVLPSHRMRREAKALEIIKAMRPMQAKPSEYFHVPTEREEALQDRIDAPEHIYFVYSAGRVKIGYSTNWRARVDAVCQGCGHEAALVLVMPGDRKMEQGYHSLFHESRESGEWFRLDGNVRRFLDLYASAEGREVLKLAHDGFLEIA